MRDLLLADRLHQTLQDLEGKKVSPDVLKELVRQDAAEHAADPASGGGQPTGRPLSQRSMAGRG
jgi:hypothetical protein